MSDFTFRGRGKFLRLETSTTKAGKPMYTAIIEVDGKYPQQIPMKVFGALTGVAANIAAGSDVQVEGRVGGRGMERQSLWGHRGDSHCGGWREGKSAAATCGRR